MAWLLNGIIGFFKFLFKEFFRNILKSTFLGSWYKMLLILGFLPLVSLLMNKAIQFFLDYLLPKLDGLSAIPPAVCYVFNRVDLFSTISLYLSVLLTYGIVKFVMRFAAQVILGLR